MFGNVGDKNEATLNDVLSAIDKLDTAISELQTTVDSQQLDGILNDLKPLLSNQASYDVYAALRDIDSDQANENITEAQAKEKGLQVKVGTFTTMGNGRSKILGCKEGFVKLVTEARTGEILGAVIVAPHATDMIAEIAAAMKAEATVEEISDTVHPHPTISEMIMEAAHDVEHLSTNKI